MHDLAVQVRGAQRRGVTPLSRTRLGILIVLLALTAASWTMLLYRRETMDPASAMAPTMGMSALLFLAVWVAMTAATMLPAATPMVLMFARINEVRRTRGSAWVPTGFFLAGYLVVWTALGLLAYVTALGAENLAGHSEWVRENAARIGGGLIVVAGAYQFSKLKDRCLTECRSPMAFVARSWREGGRGALVMGIHHGLDCAGCCWALMAMLFPLGMMNIAALAGVTAFIYAEKVLPAAGVLRHGAGIALMAAGLLVLVEPSLLPGTMAHAMHG